VVNYNTRLLGRKGVMEVSLVVDPEKLSATMPAYQALLKDYDFKQGERYAEFRQGDKIAKYGLAALVTGAVGLLRAVQRYQLARGIATRRNGGVGKHHRSGRRQTREENTVRSAHLCSTFLRADDHYVGRLRSADFVGAEPKEGQGPVRCIELRADRAVSPCCRRT